MTSKKQHHAQEPQHQEYLDAGVPEEHVETLQNMGVQAGLFKDLFDKFKPVLIKLIMDLLSSTPQAQQK
jgi:hypothetical protein